MRSHEVLKQAVDRVGAKRVAADVEVSTSLVYKWCEQPSSDDGQERSGARNPLDRLLSLMESTGDPEVLGWLCQQAGGTFVPDPVPGENECMLQYLEQTQRLIENFSELLRVTTASMQDDSCIDADEAGRIRKEWQDLKRYGEYFVRACEEGLFTGGK